MNYLVNLLQPTEEDDCVKSPSKNRKKKPTVHQVQGS